MFSQIQRFASKSGFTMFLVGGAIYASSTGVRAQVMPGVTAPTGAATAGAATAPTTPNGVVAPGTTPAVATPTVPVATTFTPNGGSADFLLDTDDVIAVQVANHPEMSDLGLAVSTLGKVALPIVGPLTVRGKTVAQAQQLVTKAFSRELKNPKVTVILVRARPRQVMMLGAVRMAGPINMNQGWRVSEALAAAGSLSDDPRYIQATLVRGKQPPMPLKLSEILTTPSSSANVKLAPNDVLNFASTAPLRVTLMGEAILTPGIVPLRGERGEPRVLDALLASGGIKYRADQMRLTLLRDGKTTSLNLPAIAQGSSISDNIALKEGDVLVFEGIPMNISVMSLDGLVKTSGNYPLVGTTTVLRALQVAGGLSVPPDKVVTSIRRGERTISVDLIKAVSDPSADLPLENNDILLVNWPDGPRVRIAGSVATPGPYSFKAGTTILDAIGQVGGLVGNPADISINILRTMPDGRQINLDVDASKLFQTRDLGQNVRLQDNDMIFVNPSTKLRTVFISGDVTTPGAYEVQEGEGLAELMLRAGGALPSAALSRVSITHRGGQQEVVDYSPALNGQGAKVNVSLQPGDVVNLPRNPNQVLVMNAVTKPGYVAVPENKKLTLSDALMAVGGPTNNAKTKQIAVLRRMSNGEVEKRVVSLVDIQNGKTEVLEIALLPGDVVYVPETVANPSLLAKLGQTMGAIGLFRGF